MFDESQVQNDGRQDVATSSDPTREAGDCRPEFGYACQRCATVVGKRGGYKKPYVSHEEHVRNCWPEGVSGEDYVECKLCKFAGMKITQHVKNIHGMSKDEYIAKHGHVIAFASLKNYSKSENWNWIEREKAKGNDLVKYREKMSKSVSEAIMTDPEERKRRAELLGELNKREDFRKRSSDAAKVTSARPEIIETRTKKLLEWQAQNPEVFFEKCIVPFVTWTKRGPKFSKPELLLCEILKEFSEFSFNYGQVIKSDKFLSTNKSGRKQVDFGDTKVGVYIEFDGKHHFMPLFQTVEEFERTQTKDKILDQIIVERNLMLIRISFDQFHQKRGFSENCIRKLTELLANVKCGVYRLGTSYGENNLMC